MKTLRLHRDNTLDDSQWALLMRSSLNDLDVESGEEFMVSSRRNYDPGDMNANHSVKGKKPESYWAAVKVFPHTGTQRFIILFAFYTYGPLNRYQVSDITGIPGNSARPRIDEAIDGGWLCQYGPPSDVEVLALTDAARQKLTKWWKESL